MGQIGDLNGIRSRLADVASLVLPSNYLNAFNHKAFCKAYTPEWRGAEPESSSSGLKRTATNELEIACEAWPSLPDEIQAGIVAMVKAARSR